MAGGAVRSGRGYRLGQGRELLGLRSELGQDCFERVEVLLGSAGAELIEALGQAGQGLFDLPLHGEPFVGALLVIC